MKIGSSVAWNLGDGGTAGMLEMSGSGATAIAANMEAKEKRMAVLGARLLEEQPGGGSETAEAVRMRHGASTASLRVIAQVVEQALTWVLQVHGWWVGLEKEPADVDASVELNKEFLAIKMQPAELQSLTMALQAGEISHETYWFNLTQGGIARPGITSEEERAEIDRQGDRSGPLLKPPFGEES